MLVRRKNDSLVTSRYLPNCAKGVFDLCTLLFKLDFLLLQPVLDESSFCCFLSFN